MARKIGRLIDVGIAKEATRGTVVAPTFWLPKLEFDFDDKDENVDNESSYGVIHRISDNEIVQKYAEGNISGKVMDQSFGLILSALAGTSPSSAANADTSGNVYDHTYTPAKTSNQHQSLSISVKDADLDLDYALGMLQSCSLQYQINDFFLFEAGFTSKVSASGTNTVAHTAENEFLPRHAVIKRATTEAGLGGASASEIRSATIEFNKNAVRTQVLGSDDVDDILNTGDEITINLEVYHEGTTYKDLWQNRTENAFRFTVDNTDVTIGDADTPELQIDFPRCKIVSWEREKGNDDISIETMEIKVLYDVSAGKAWDAVLTNLHDGTDY